MSKGDKTSLLKSDYLSNGGNGSKAIKKYANMSDEMEQLEVETCELLTRIRSSAEALEWDTKKTSMSKEAREQEFKRIKADMDKAKSLMQNYKVEIRELSSMEAREYEQKLRKHQESYAEIERNLTFARSMAEKSELMDGNTANGKNVEGMSAAQLIEEAKKTQQQDAVALDGMIRMVDNSEEIGVQTNIKLRAQTEQIKAINEDVSKVQANMKRADKLLNQMGRRIMTDKLLALLLLALVIGILVVIILKATGYGGSSGTTSANIVVRIYI